MSIKKILDDAIMAEPDQYVDERFREHFRISNFGRCYRYQFLYRKGEKVTNPIDIEVLRTFRLGTIIHNDLQRLLPVGATEVDVTEGDLAGHIDHLTDDYVEDFKTVGSKGWYHIIKNGFNVEEDKEQYCYQLMGYAYLKDRPYGRLTFVNKDNYEIRSFEVAMFPKWMGRIKGEILTLRAYWAKDELPPALPRAYGLRECGYCLFKDYCNKTEGNTPIDRAKLSSKKKKEEF